MSSVRYILFFFIIITSSLIGQVEVCDNGLDDDNDSLIDLNDEDCFCQIASSKSLISNPSFEELDCCPDDKSELFCATDWSQASSPTSDLIHLCGWSGVEEYPPPRPFPDGEGILGFRDGRFSSNDSLDAYWKEYAGACLISAMEADLFYRLQFDIGFIDPEISPPINVSLFGTSSCNNLPFGIGDVAFGCPSNSPNWIKLGDIGVSGGTGNKWVKSFIDIAPNQDIHAIALGPDCEPVSSGNIIYYYFDNLLLIDLASFDLLISDQSHPCDQAFSLSVTDNQDFEYQWYLSGIALAGETAPELKQNYGEGEYQVRILSGSSCRVSSPYNYIIPSFNSADTALICQGGSYKFGTAELKKAGFYIDSLQTQNGCDSIVTLQLDVIGEQYDSLEVTIAPGESFEFGNNGYREEGEYFISTPSSLGCDSIFLFKLSHFSVFVPNIFSPNMDGVNDIFRPSALLDEVISYEMSIYNRWGNLVYEGVAWDGVNASQDVYVYAIQASFVTGSSHTFKGSVTLVR